MRAEVSRQVGGSRKRLAAELATVLLSIPAVERLATNPTKLAETRIPTLHWLMVVVVVTADVRIDRGTLRTCS